MRRLFRHCSALTLTLCAGAFFSSAEALTLNAKSYFIYEPTTGSVVLEKNSDMQMAPASLTKMMTIHLLFDALSAGELTLEDTLPVSEKAWRKGGSKMFIEVGKKIRVEDLIKGILVSSGNDACITVAEYLAGTEDAFTDMMNDKAESLGLYNTTFKNATGWPNPKQVSTAKDMTKLAVSLIQTYPEYYKYFSIERFTYNNISQPNRNGLLRRNVGVDGLKTGHVDDAGYHLTASAQRHDVRLVSTVMGTGSMRAREEETLAGLSYGFRTHEMQAYVKKGQVIDKEAPVLLGDVETVSLIAKDTVKMYLPKRKNAITVEADYEKPLKAPLRAGQKVGIVRIFSADGVTKEVDLVVQKDVKELEGLSRYWKQFIHAVTE